MTAKHFEGMHGQVASADDSTMLADRQVIGNLVISRTFTEVVRHISCIRWRT